MDEFALIKKYFVNAKNQNLCKAKGIVLGIGDDAAVYTIASGRQMVSSMDTLIADVHFPSNCCASDIAYKALSVNLSDLAAMGASAHSFSLSLSLPALDETWLKEFSKALFELANREEVVLLGGDTSKGPLSISIQINGEVREYEFLCRDTAQANDLICVTGFLGLAGLGLREWQTNNLDIGGGPNTAALERFLRPHSRLDFSQSLYSEGVRTCIDVSDGVISELQHLCDASGVSAFLDVDSLLVHEELNALGETERLNLMLSAGDDYELCFSVAPECLPRVKALANQCALPLSVIGEFKKGKSKVFDIHGKPLELSSGGYQHF